MAAIQQTHDKSLVYLIVASLARRGNPMDRIEYGNDAQGQ
jgi:hypothetical protein